MNTVRQEFNTAQSAARRKEAAAEPSRLAYHLMPPVGWMNDPNGLCQYNGLYHIFYQYTPGSADGHDHRGWGHYTTKDFIHYTEQDDPFVPDSESDGKGSYSGSAFLEDGKMHIFFTGNNKLPGDYDYINEGRIHWVLHSASDDGLHFTGKEVLLKNADYPADLSCHVRDPKILRRNGQYYMVLGARTKDSKGQAEIFKSKDLHKWEHCSTIRPEAPFGYMWECPDLIELEGKTFLLTCPQGLKTEGILYENIYQNGYFEVKGSLDEDQKVKNFQELDNGFDFYAPQSFEDEKGRRILIGWMGIPDAGYTNPTGIWQHALTLPRELTLKGDRIYQYPIEEMLHLRKKEEIIHLEAGQCTTLPSRVCEIELHPHGESWTIDLRKDCQLSYDKGIFALSLKESGSGRDVRHVKVDHIDSLEIFSDVSSLEIFINHGQYALTTRIYDGKDDVKLCASTNMDGKMWSLKSFEIEEKIDKKDPTL